MRYSRASTLVELPVANGRDRTAFTLVELLVVVAIIALLIAILLPALDKARGVARSVACLANVRAINIGVAMYAADNRNSATPATIRRRSSGGPAPANYWSGTDVSVWHDILLGQYTGVHATATSVTGEIPARSIWRCPEGAGEADSTWPHYSHSACYTGSGWSQLFAAIRTTDDWPERLNKLSNVAAPAKCMTFADMDAWTPFSYGNSPQTSPFYGHPNGAPHSAGWSKDVPLSNRNHLMRHPPGDSLGTNMGFVDGHASTLINQPSDEEGHYWLKPVYNIEFVVRPTEQ